MQSVPPRLPFHLVPKSFLREVPEEIYSSCNTGQPARLKLSIGGWINLPLGHQFAVSLLLVYCDDSGEHAVLVEEMNARGASEILLSGEVEVEAANVEYMRLYCGGISDKSVWASNLQIGLVEIAANDGKESPEGQLAAN